MIKNPKPSTSLLKLIKNGVMLYTDSWEDARIRRGTMFGGIVVEKKRLADKSWLYTKRYPVSLEGLADAMNYAFNVKESDKDDTTN